MTSADPKAIAEGRFWSRVHRRGPEECWPWAGKLYEGYGSISLAGKTMRAHRLSAILAGLDVQPGLHVDHTCRNRACVNPAHLRVVSPRINTLENSAAITAINAKKTHCVRGHPLSGDNLRMKKGGRVCIACARQMGRECERKRYAARKAARVAVETCTHEWVNEGPRIPLRWGSGATEICTDCGAWRQTRVPNEPWAPAATLAKSFIDPEEAVRRVQAEERGHG